MSLRGRSVRVCVCERQKDSETEKEKSCAFVSSSSRPVSPWSPWEIHFKIFSPFSLLMCLPVWEEGENWLNKREEKERETAIARSQTSPAYSALSAALRRVQLWDVKICLWLHFFPLSRSHKDSLDVFMLIFWEEEWERERLARPYSPGSLKHT